MLDLTIFIIGILTSIVLWNLLKGRRSTRLINSLPGPPAWPILGNLADITLSTDEIIPLALKRGKEYGPIFRIWAGHLPIVVVSSAEYIEVILSNNHEIQKSFVYRFLEEWLGLGLLTSAGSRWSKHRKMITPTFHFKILESFIPIFESNSKVMLEKLSEKVKTKEVFDIYPYITLCALDVICETAMGINLNAQNGTSSEYINAIYGISRLITERFGRFYMHPSLIYRFTPSGRKFSKYLKTLHDFTGGIIRERKELRKNEKVQISESDEGVKKRKAFLDLLLDCGADLTDTDLREEVDTFMFEGHDTTTAGISWSIYLLGRNPEIQEQVAEEITSLWPKGESLTLQTLSEMKLLERVIKETLRLYPSVPFISRTLQNDLKFGQYLIPANTTISISTEILHRNEKVFPEPTKFDPDRFLPENVQKRHPYAYVPFSAGPRNCIGQKFAILEEKAILASVIRSYKFEAVENENDIIVCSELIQRPKNGINLRISKRL